MILSITQEEQSLMESELKFEKDLRAGKVGEKMARQYLEQKGLLFVRESTERKEMKKWDIEMLFNHKLIQYEIKTDVFIKPERFIYSEFFKKEMKHPAIETGNMFVEYHSRGVDSGIVTTTADVWMYFYYYLNELWIIEVDKLRKLIKDNEFPRHEDSGDPNSHTMGYLIPRFEYKEHFKIINYQKQII